MRKLLILCLLLTGFQLTAQRQHVVLQGHVYDVLDKTRIPNVELKVYAGNSLVVEQEFTSSDGNYQISLPKRKSYTLELISAEHKIKRQRIDTKGNDYVNFIISMERLRGYNFLGNIFEYTSKTKEYTEEVYNAKVEIYNLTTSTEELNTEYNPGSLFNFNFAVGNRYTVMVRKIGYFAKRFDVMVSPDNCDGCILCFEGLDAYAPATFKDSPFLSETGFQGDIPLKKIVLDESIELEDIYYDYNKSNIRSDARKPLNKLVKLMEMTPIVIELSSHTDSRGRDEYNMNLSQKRAESAVQYIISKGIDSNRITAKGYGETQLKNHCSDGVNCSKAEHQRNRRTEFKVTRLITSSNFDNKSLAEIIEEERRTNRKSVQTMIFD